jgi:hypothetical protein
MSRRRGLLVALAALTVTMVAVAPVEAGRRWCSKDPIFLIAGTQVNVEVAIWEEHQPAVTGPIAVTLYVPLNVSAVLIAVDDGYNGYGEVVSIVPTSRLALTNRGPRVLVEVTVPASRVDMPVNVFVTPLGHRTISVNGKPNNIVPVNLVVPQAA